MIPARAFAQTEVAVFGLARSGIASVRALRAGGARVYAWDDKDEARGLAECEGATAKPWADWPWQTLKALVLSPGVALTHPAPHPVVARARDAGVAIIGDMEIFAKEMAADPAVPGRAPVIAVTGTNGKSTTTALIGHILEACGYDVQLGGNIGHAVLDLDPPGAKTVYVLELSSYQIDLAPGLVPDVAVLSNITPDHIERHGSLENYAAVKARLLKQASKSGHIVIGVDDAPSAAIFTHQASHNAPPAVPVSVGKVLGRGVFVIDGALYDAQSQRATKVMDLTQAENLKGAHNQQNAALAFAATKPFAKNTRIVVDAITDFSGLAHRMENVGHIGKVGFVNNSKATNADAAARALSCYGNIFWIAGGKAKQGGIGSLEPYFPRIRKAYLIGEAAAEFARTLEGKTSVVISKTLESAVQSAFADASDSALTAPVVLLSPASASFDQFSDFEARGEAFRALVHQLKSLPVREAS